MSFLKINLSSSLWLISYFRNTNDASDQKCPKKLRRIRYIGDLTENDFSTPKRGKKSLQIVQRHFQKAKQRLKIAYEKCRRLFNKNIKLTCMLRKLEEDRYLSLELSHTIQVNLNPVCPDYHWYLRLHILNLPQDWNWN